MVILPHMERELCRLALVRRASTHRLITINPLVYGYLTDRARTRLCLTTTRERHNNIDSNFTGESYGQTQQGRSETTGAQTHWHTQSSPGRWLRHFVSRESVL